MLQAQELQRRARRHDDTRQGRRSAAQAGREAGRDAALAGCTVEEAREEARVADAAAMAAAAAARAAAEAAQARTYEMLEEYSASYLDWAVHLLAWARPAREGRLVELTSS